MSSKGDLKLAAVVSFLNEAKHLPKLLASIDSQTERPQQLMLVDDGSSDASLEIASAFADGRSWVRTFRRPVRPPSKDRLVSAPELLAFQAGLEHLEEPWDIVLKLDGDLQLSAEIFEEVRLRFVMNPRLGITGPELSAFHPDGSLRRERNPPDHVRGATKCYRRECYEQLAPLPPILGWDTIDELRARLHGWTTGSFPLTSAESIHLRPTGGYDGRLCGYRRWGRCAWGYGAHPLWVIVGGLYRMRERPYVLAGVNYVWGWSLAALRGYPRAEPAVRAHARLEELRELRRRMSLLACRVRQRIPLNRGTPPHISNQQHNDRVN